VKLDLKKKKGVCGKLRDLIGEEGKRVKIRRNRVDLVQCEKTNCDSDCKKLSHSCHQETEVGLPKKGDGEKRKRKGNI